MTPCDRAYLNSYLISLPMLASISRLVSAPLAWSSHCRSYVQKVMRERLSVPYGRLRNVLYGSTPCLMECMSKMGMGVNRITRTHFFRRV